MLGLGGGGFDHIMRYLKEITFVEPVTMFNKISTNDKLQLKKNLIKSSIESEISVTQFCLPLS